MSNLVLADSDFLNDGLTAICDMVREKTWTNSPLSFPDGIVSAISSISEVPGYELFHISIRMSSSFNRVSVIDSYAKEYAYVLLYPNEWRNSALNTIAVGFTPIPDSLAVTTKTGVELSIPQCWYANDRLYNQVRHVDTLQGNAAAGTYELYFYGLPKVGV